MDIFKIMGSRLRDIRKAKNMSLDDVSDKCGVNCNYIGQVERAIKNPTLTTLKKITDALDITLTEIISYAENASEYSRSQKLNEIILMLEDSKDSELEQIETLLHYIMNIANLHAEASEIQENDTSIDIQSQPNINNSNSKA